MAKTVANVQEVELLDGTEVTLRPLSVLRLKEFMKAFHKLQELEEPDEDKIMDILVDCSAVAMKKQLPDVASYVDIKADTKNEEDRKKRESLREEYLDMVDMDTVNFINEICGGIKFDVPNPLSPAAGAAGTN